MAFEYVSDTPANVGQVGVFSHSDVLRNVEWVGEVYMNTTRTGNWAMHFYTDVSRYEVRLRNDQLPMFRAQLEHVQQFADERRAMYGGR